MGKALSGPIIAGVLAVVVIAVLVIGYRYMGGGGHGERPAAIAADPHMSRMYGAPGQNGAGAGSQGK